MPRFVINYLLRWVPLAVLVGVLGGTASAVLLVSLAFATVVREAHPWLIGLLPLGGLAVGLMYHLFGKAVERGNNLVLDEVYSEVEEPRRAIPARMTPLILVGTFLTHLFGGSAGREGTAIQMGASLADQLAAPFRLGWKDRRLLLMAGISAGFGSVFGTPLAGAVFGVEVLAMGEVTLEAALPCLIAALVGDAVTRMLRIHHTSYVVDRLPHAPFSWIGYTVLAGAVFGLAAAGFVWTTHALSRAFKRQFEFAPLRPFAGGVVVALAVVAVGSTKYIGLGLPVIQAAFSGRQPWWDWVAKIGFTAVTLGAGFKGGEVTPLFYIGATLGNALAWVMPLPPGLLAGMGFVAVFAGAANTPVASTVMAFELFGWEVGLFSAVACLFSYLFSGPAGIYTSQRVGVGRFLRR